MSGSARTVVVWYYVPIARLWSAAIVTSTLHSLGAAGPIVSLIALAVTLALTVGYRRANGGRLPADLGPRAQLRTVAVVLVLGAAIGGGPMLSYRLGTTWPAWMGAMILSALVLVGGAAYETAIRRRQGASAPDSPTDSRG